MRATNQNSFTLTSWKLEADECIQLLCMNALGFRVQSQGRVSSGSRESTAGGISGAGLQWRSSCLGDYRMLSQAHARPRV